MTSLSDLPDVPRRPPFDLRSEIAAFRAKPDHAEGVALLAKADASGDPLESICALVAVAPYLPIADRAEAIARALAAVTYTAQFPSNFLEHHRFDMYAPGLELALLGRVEHPIFAARDHRDRMWALALLMPHLAADQQEEAANELAVSIEHHLTGVRALRAMAALLRWLPERETARRQAWVFAGLQVLPTEDRASMGLEVARILQSPASGTALAMAFMAARRVEDETRRFSILEQLWSAYEDMSADIDIDAPGLPPHVAEANLSLIAQEALAAAKAIDDVGSRKAALLALIRDLPYDYANQAIKKAERILPGMLWRGDPPVPVFGSDGLRSIEFPQRNRAIFRVVESVAFSKWLPAPSRTKFLVSCLKGAVGHGYDALALALRDVATSLPEENYPQSFELVLAHFAPPKPIDSIPSREIRTHEREMPQSRALSRTQAYVLARNEKERHVDELVKQVEELSGQQASALVEEALATARSFGGFFAVRTLRRLARALPAERAALLEEAATVVRDASEFALPMKATLLAAIAAELSGANSSPLRGEAWDLARKIDSPENRCSTMAEIASGAPKDEALPYWEQVIAVAASISDPMSLGATLAPTIAKLPEAVIPKLLHRVRNVGDAALRSWLLVALMRPKATVAAVLYQSLQIEAASLARAIEDPWTRVRALCDVSPFYSGAERYRLLADAYAAALLIDDLAVRDAALYSVRRQITRDSIDSSSWSHLRARVVPVRPRDAADPALGDPLTIDGWLWGMFSRTIEPLAPGWLPPRQLSMPSGPVNPTPVRPDRALVVENALLIARALETAGARAAALSRLLPAGGELFRSIADEALSAAREVESPEAKVQSLLEIARHLPETTRGAVISEAREVARRTPSPLGRLQALIAVAETDRSMPDPVELTTAAAGSPLEYVYIQSTVAKYRPQEEHQSVLTQILATARSIEDPAQRSLALARICRLRLEL